MGEWYLVGRAPEQRRGVTRGSLAGARRDRRRGRPGAHTIGAVYQLNITGDTGGDWSILATDLVIAVNGHVVHSSAFQAIRPQTDASYCALPAPCGNQCPALVGGPAGVCGQCQCAYAFPDSVVWPLRPGDFLEAWVAPSQGSLPEIDTSNDHFAAILDPLFVDPAPATTSLAVMPNPFTGVMRIRFAVPLPTRADVTVLDVAGRCVRALGRGIALAAGPGELSWDGCDESGRHCPPGVYAVRVEMAGHTLLRHVVLVR